MTEPIYHIPPDLTIGDTFGTLEAAPTNWGMRATHIDRFRKVAGEGRIIAILDTGVDPSHPEFAGGKIIEARSFVPGESEIDRNGHGPHCGSTAAGNSPTVGVAHKAKLIFGKVLSNSGSGQSSWIEAGFRWAMSMGAHCISMSIGGPGFLRGMEPLFREAVSRGIIPSVAAGNERPQGGIADDCTALVWGAVDINGRFATFSNPGRQATTLVGAAPGVNIVGARTGGGYVTMSGTSMATPFGSGTVELVQSERIGAGLPPLTFEQMRRLFASRNVDAGQPGADRDYGAGLIDGELLRLSLVPMP